MRTISGCIVLLVWIAPSLAFSQTPSDSSYVGYFSSPQQVLAFADFLASEGNCPRAITEYQRHLFLAPDIKPGEVHFRMGRCRLDSGQSRLAAESFFRSQQSFESKIRRDSAYVARLGALLLVGSHNEFHEALTDSQRKELPDALKGKVNELRTLSYMSQREWALARELYGGLAPGRQLTPWQMNLTPLIERGERYSPKSAVLAGLMSAILPGSGKWYAGRFSDGLYSLALIGGTTWMAYDGFHSNGTHSVKGWIFSSLGFALYTGNIYGSVVAVRVRNDRLQNELMDEIQHYISVSAKL